MINKLLFPKGISEFFDFVINGITIMIKDISIAITLSNYFNSIAN